MQLQHPSAVKRIKHNLFLQSSLKVENVLDLHLWTRMVSSFHAVYYPQIVIPSRVFFAIVQKFLLNAHLFYKYCARTKYFPSYSLAILHQKLRILHIYIIKACSRWIHCIDLHVELCRNLFYKNCPQLYWSFLWGTPYPIICSIYTHGKNISGSSKPAVKFC